MSSPFTGKIDVHNHIVPPFYAKSKSLSLLLAPRKDFIANTSHSGSRNRR
jgi:hypothetical protein